MEKEALMSVTLLSLRNSQAWHPTAVKKVTQICMVIVYQLILNGGWQLKIQSTFYYKAV